MNIINLILLNYIGANFVQKNIIGNIAVQPVKGPPILL